MKEYARQMFKHGIPVKRRPRKSLREMSEASRSPERHSRQKKEPEIKTRESDPQAVETIPDSWVQPKSKKEPEIKRRKRGRPVEYAANETRRSRIGFCVSETEIALLKARSKEEGLTFSKWARTILLREVGGGRPSEK